MNATGAWLLSALALGGMGNMPMPYDLSERIARGGRRTKTTPEQRRKRIARRRAKNQVARASRQLNRRLAA